MQDSYGVTWRRKMKKMLSAFVLALVMVAFAGCGKEKPATIEKKDIKTLEEKAGDVATEALKQVPAETKEDPASSKPKDHPAH
jgi:predicted small lipoprotein YifL